MIFFDVELAMQISISSINKLGEFDKNLQAYTKTKTACRSALIGIVIKESLAIKPLFKHCDFHSRVQWSPPIPLVGFTMDCELQVWTQVCSNFRRNRPFEWRPMTHMAVGGKHGKTNGPDQIEQSCSTGEHFHVLAHDWVISEDQQFRFHHMLKWLSVRSRLTKRTCRSN